ncbi:MAG TPA: YdeI/OmpD-associated family protein [Polyangiaceae bacterium]|jgi:uncharacterized protein YdeI (YjbR/CyaY-like superfamily)|nr:YdeI/OmpD-associated family protein [Polyangiaceae bacterium]
MATIRKLRNQSARRKKAPTTTAAGNAKVESDSILAPPSAKKWNAWLRSNHARSAGIFLLIPRKGGRSTLTYAAALDIALAWGWIDSQKRALDNTAWLQRFTPRTQRSPWSKINRAKAEALIASGRMEPPGLAEIDRAKRDGRWGRAYVGAKASTVPSDLVAALAKNARARAFFENLDAANRYSILYRVTTAKLPETRAKRVATFVALCAAHKTLHPVHAKAARAASGSRKATPRAR